VIRLRADVRGLSLALRRVSTQLDQLFSGVRQGTLAFSGLDAVAAGAAASLLAFAAGLADVTKKAADVEFQMKRLESLFVAMTTYSEDLSKDMAALSDRAIEVGMTTIFSAKEAGEAMNSLVEAGLTASETYEVVAKVAKFAAISNMDLARASTVVVQIMRAFNMTAEEMDRILGVVSTAAFQTTALVGDMALSIGFAAGIASELGLTLEETAKWIGVLTDKLAGARTSFVQAGKAGRYLRSFLFEITEPRIAKRLERVGVQIWDVSGERIRSVTEIMDDFRRLAGTMSRRELVEFANKLGLGRVAATTLYYMLQADSEYLNRIQRELSDVADWTEVYEKRQEALNWALLRLKNVLQGVEAVLGKELVPGIARAINRLSDWIYETLYQTGYLEELSRIIANKVVPMIDAFVDSIIRLGNWLKESGLLVKGLEKAFDLIPIVTQTLLLLSVFKTFTFMLKSLSVDMGGWADAVTESFGRVEKSVGWLDRIFSRFSGNVKGVFAKLTRIMLGFGRVEVLAPFTETLLVESQRASTNVLRVFSGLRRNLARVFRGFRRADVEVFAFPEIVGEEVITETRRRADVIFNVFADLRERLRDVFTRIGDMLLALVEPFRSFGEGASNAFVGVLSRLSVLKLRIARFGSSAAAVFAGLVGKIGVLGEKFGWLNVQVQRAVAGINLAFAALTDRFTAWGGAVANVFAGVARRIKMLGGSFWAFVAKVEDALGAVVGRLLGLRGVFARVGGYVTRFGAVLFAPIIRGLGVLEEAAAVAFSGLASRASSVLSIIGHLFGRFAGWVGGLSLSVRLIGTFASLAAKISVSLLALIGPLGLVVGAVSFFIGAWEQNLFKLREKLKSLFDEVSGYFGSFIEQIKGYAVKLGEKFMATDWRMVWDKIRGAMDLGYKIILERLTSWGEAFDKWTRQVDWARVAQQLGEFLKGIFAAAFDALWMGADLIVRFLEGIVAWLDRALSDPTIIDTAVENFFNAIERMLGVLSEPDTLAEGKRNFIELIAKIFVLTPEIMLKISAFTVKLTARFFMELAERMAEVDWSQVWSGFLDALSHFADAAIKQLMSAFARPWQQIWQGILAVVETVKNALWGHSFFPDLQEHLSDAALALKQFEVELEKIKSPDLEVKFEIPEVPRIPAPIVEMPVVPTPEMPELPPMRVPGFELPVLPTVELPVAGFGMMDRLWTAAVAPAAAAPPAAPMPETANLLRAENLVRIDNLVVEETVDLEDVAYEVGRMIDRELRLRGYA